MAARLRMLLSVYACAPQGNADERAGWNQVELSRLHDVWALTRAANRRNIERALKETPLPSVHFIYFDLPRWLILPARLHGFIWQIGANLLSREWHTQIDFETVHHVIPSGWRIPNFLPVIPARFVWVEPEPVQTSNSSPLPAPVSLARVAVGKASK